MKLQLFISHSGVCSRREALKVIQEGLVKVNNCVVKEPSTVIDPKRDKIVYKSKQVFMPFYEYVLLNKPRGYLTTKSDPYAKRTIYDLLPRAYQKLAPVGRLDKETEGLIILTNDGNLSYQMTHPKFNLDKKYFVIVEGDLSLPKIKKLEKGVFIEGKRTAPARIRSVKRMKEQTQFYLTIHEGKKRQIRRMLKMVKHRVIYLKRIAQGPLTLGNLKSGHHRVLSKKEIQTLKDFAHD